MFIRKKNADKILILLERFFMNEEKQKIIDWMSVYKEETLEKDASLIERFREAYEKNALESCNLFSDPIEIVFCESDEEKKMWKAFVHLTTSSVYKGAVGRQVKIFVKSRNVILGMVHLVSPLAQMRVRDEYLLFENKWKQLREIYNIEVCVPTKKYANLLTGKLLVYGVFTNEVCQYLESKYGDKVTGFETTSLYGKSSMYNRIPFFKYLGLTDGMSALFIKDDEWKKILEEYYEVYPNTKTNRLAPVKFQIVDKLATYYRKAGKRFPYQYQSKEFQRGVYFGYKREIDLSEAVDEWRKRWLSMRWENGYRPDYQNILAQ